MPCIAEKHPVGASRTTDHYMGNANVVSEEYEQLMARSCKNEQDRLATIGQAVLDDIC